MLVDKSPEVKSPEDKVEDSQETQSVDESFKNAAKEYRSRNLEKRTTLIEKKTITETFRDTNKREAELNTNDYQIKLGMGPEPLVPKMPYHVNPSPSCRDAKRINKMLDQVWFSYS